MIVNPILPGFNADPSIVRVGETYYIATSTFEWYPGVQIHRSTDLVNWELATRPLDRAELLDMRGNPDSGGIWAPCLSYADGRFWLVYTDVKRLDGSFKDCHNYITTAERIEGPWSAPIYVNSKGFDASLFHDDDGKKYFLNLRWNHRGPGTGGNPAHASFDGIFAQEWSEEGGLTGPVMELWHGTDRGLTEGPHLFKREGYYYLTVAEGGTGYDHAVSMARSRELAGPYETHPQKHLICTAAAPRSPIQRTGHGQYVETPQGEGYHTFLMGRPIAGPDGTGHFCPLGRETGIERVVWRDGWLWLEEGGMVPRAELPGPVEAERAAPQPRETDFAAGLPAEFQWLRHPEPARLFRTGAGGLTLIGRESLGSHFEQALVARRQEHHVYQAECTLAEFVPDSYQQAAGLTTYYNRHKLHAALVSGGEEGEGRFLSVVSCPGDWPDARLDQVTEPLPIGDGAVELRVEVDHAHQQFFWRQGGGDWQALGPRLDASVISDEGGRGEHGSFTGAFVGMVAFDVAGYAREARFSRFAYHPGGPDSGGPA